MAFQTHFTGLTSAAEVANFHRNEIRGKTIVVTGVGPNGLGSAVIEALAPHSPGLLIMTGRDPKRPTAVAEALQTQHRHLKTAVVHMDLSSSKSVKDASCQIRTLCTHIDMLVNNAGVMCIPSLTLTEEEVESHLSVNYLGPFLLTWLLAGHLGRIVNVSSGAHAVSPFRFSDPHFTAASTCLPADEEPSPDACAAFEIPWTSSYAPLVAYAQSKTAGMLHARAIADGAMGDRVAAYSVNPGVIETNLWRHMPPHEVHEILHSVPTKSAAQGAATIVAAMLDPALADHAGGYLEDCTLTSPAPHANDSKVAKKLWDWTFPILSIDPETR